MKRVEAVVTVWVEEDDAEDGGGLDRIHDALWEGFGRQYQVEAVDVEEL
jgi:hypothetical protein